MFSVSIRFMFRFAYLPGAILINPHLLTFEILFTVFFQHQRDCIRLYDICLEQRQIRQVQCSSCSSY